MFFWNRKAQDEEKEKKHQEQKELAEFYDAVWEAANTIYLYAALSEEEARSPSLKKKQEEIRQTAEELLELAGKKGGIQK